PTMTYTLSLHDALPILLQQSIRPGALRQVPRLVRSHPRIGQDARAVRNDDVRTEHAVVAPLDRSRHEIRAAQLARGRKRESQNRDRKSTRLNSSHVAIS